MAGAWSWYLWSQQDPEAARILMNRGSVYPATALVKAKRVSCLVQDGTAELFSEDC